MNLPGILRKRVEEILSAADVRIDGDRPWDVCVHDSRFFARALFGGALGLGESYMDGWWDCRDLPEMFRRVLTAHLERRVSATWPRIAANARAFIANCQRQSRARWNVHRHYDLGNDLYRNMLGRWMLYSSANWERANSLDEAGEGKLEFICRRLNLQPGQSVLDIGCGWGGFAKYAALKYGVQVVGITVSSEQAELARELCSDLPVEIRYLDYRHLDGRFDHIVSLGMFEHVGYKNYRRYMQIVRSCLKPGGLFFLNTIGVGASEHCTNAWTDKYIFPGGMLPSMAQIGKAIDGILAIRELQDWADYYDRTLIVWLENFRRNWGRLASRYGDAFYRMWEYYLLSSAGAFRAHTIEDWQIVLTP